MKIYHFLFSAICILLMALSCEKEPQVIKVESVSLNSTSLTIVEGESQSLIATVSPSTATNKAVIWSSSNSSVATVDDRGTVTAIAPGTATITAKSDDGGKTATCSVKVNTKVYPVESVFLDKTTAEITEGETLTLTATIKPENATNKNVIWSSSNEEVATVKNGVVTAIKEGEATITAKTADGGKTATCNVIVNPKTVSVTGVDLNKTSIELGEGDKTTLLATIFPENATNKNVLWSSSDDNIITVNNGELTAISPGNAIVYAETEDGGFVAKCNVTVKGIKFQNTVISIMEGESAKLPYICYPSDLKLIWSSSNSEIASVDNDGLVLAKKKGITTISVCSVDDNYSAECQIVVTDVSDLVDIWCYSLDISGSGSFLSGTFTPGAKITWAIMNNTPYLITIKNVALLDGISRTPVNYSLEDWIVISSGQGIVLTTTILANMYMPIIQITFGSYGGNYTKEYQFNGSIGRMSSTGTFVQSKNVTLDVKGPSGIPEGWTVQIVE